MKQYEFHSALPPERVFARLSVRVKETQDLDPWTEKGAFLCYRKEKRFSLTYTGKIPVRGFVPFRGTVTPEGEGSLISGDFALPFQLLFGLALFAFAAALLFGAPLWFAATGALISFPWFSLFGSLTQFLFFRKRQKKILSFIQENLLE